jgi:soluble lytic murein transglycosylase-like protein
MFSRRFRTALMIASTAAVVACGVGRVATDRAASGASGPGVEPAVVRSVFPAEPVLRPGPRAAADRETIAALALEHQPAASPDWAYDVADVIYAEAREHGLDPLLVAALMARESSFRPGVISHMGAMGLMQVRPFVGEAVAQRSDVDWYGPEVLHDPEANIRVGTRYLVELLDRFDGDVYLALAAYHRGPTRVALRLASGGSVRSRYAEGILGLQATLANRRIGIGTAAGGARLVASNTTRDDIDG